MTATISTVSRTLTAPSAALAASTSAMWTVESDNSVFSDEALVALSDFQVPVSSFASNPDTDYASIDALPALYEEYASAFDGSVKRKLSVAAADTVDTIDATPPPYFALDAVALPQGAPTHDVVLNTFSNELYDLTASQAESAAGTPTASASATPSASRAASPSPTPSTTTTTTRKSRAGSVPTSRAALATATSDDAHDKYLRRRRNNNESACRSRAKRRQLEKENAERVADLQRTNAELVAKMEKLENEAKYLRSLLLTLAKNAAMPATAIDALIKGEGDASASAAAEL